MVGKRHKKILIPKEPGKIVKIKDKNALKNKIKNILKFGHGTKRLIDIVDNPNPNEQFESFAEFLEPEEQNDNDCKPLKQEKLNTPLNLFSFETPKIHLVKTVEGEDKMLNIINDIISSDPSNSSKEFHQKENIHKNEEEKKLFNINASTSAKNKLNDDVILHTKKIDLEAYTNHPIIKQSTDGKINLSESQKKILQRSRSIMQMTKIREEKNEQLVKNVLQKLGQCDEEDRTAMRNLINMVYSSIQSVEDQPSSDVYEVFDANKSLSAKIINKLHAARNLKKDRTFHIQKNESTYIPENIFTGKQYTFKKPKKLVQNTDYSKSVMEVFGFADEINKSAVISTADVKEEMMPEESDTDVEEVVLKPVDEDTFENNSINETALHFSSYECLEESAEEGTANDMQFAQHFSYTNKFRCQEEEGGFELLLTSTCCVAFLKPFTKLFFSGKLMASILFGNVEVLGSPLTDKPQEMYSLTCSSLLCFETIPGGEPLTYSHLLKELNKLNIKLTVTSEELMMKSKDCHSVLLLKPLDNKMTRFVQHHLKELDIFEKGKLESITDPFVDATSSLGCSFTTIKHKGFFYKSLQWSLVTNHVEQLSQQKSSLRNVTMVCGGRGVGKSTFVRYIVNKLLVTGPVLVMDLDPGQSEFTMCGLLSVTLVDEPLLGQNFTHLRGSERSLCLGLTDITENKERYVLAVEDLFKYCQTEKYADIPLIVNTAGFTGSPGTELILSLIAICRPSTVVDIKSSNNKNNFEINLDPNTIIACCQNGTYQEKYVTEHTFDHTYFYLDPYQCTLDPTCYSVHRSIDSKTKRLLNILAYFSSISTSDSVSILNMIPYVISMDKIGLGFNNVTVPNEYVASIINARIVALCSYNYSKSDHKGKTIFKLPNSPVECHGYGIIRGVDITKRLLYLLTPVSSSVIWKVNTLVYAECMPNCEIFSVDLPPNTRLPYATVVASETDMKLARNPRRRFKFRFNPLKAK